MELLATNRFRLKPYSEVDAWLLDKGQRAGVLYGRVMESQYQIGTHILLFITNDCMFEEMLSIYLLTPEYRVLEHKLLGYTFPLGSPGFYDNETLVSPMQMEFSFQGNWRLSVREGIVDFDRQKTGTRTKEQKSRQDILVLEQLDE